MEFESIKKDKAPDSMLRKQYFDSAAGFFANSENASKTGHQLHDMVLYCTYNHRPCNMSDFVLHQDPNFFNCWKFTGVNTIKNGQVYSGPGAGLSLILYTDYVKDSPVNDYQFHNVIGGSNAIRIQISERGVYPSPLESGIDVSAGESTSISLGAKRTTME